MHPAVNLLIPAIFIAFHVAERVIPARSMPAVPRWRLKGVLMWMLSGAIVTNLPALFAPWMKAHALMDLSSWGLLAAPPAFVTAQLVAYGLHRLRHREPLWRFHQLHHSAERHDISGTFLFHPVESAYVPLMSTAVTIGLFGLSPTTASVLGLYAFFATCFQHANIKTPRFLGYVIQRPESHSIHHARDAHAFNYCDFPPIDMLFGTWRNPATFEAKQGFFDGASRQMGRMLLGITPGAKLRSVPAAVVCGALALAVVTAVPVAASVPKPAAPLPDDVATAMTLPVPTAYRARWVDQNPLKGPMSLANALRSLGDDVDTHALLAGRGLCVLDRFCPRGLTLDQVASMAPGARVVRDVDLATFRATLATANDPSVRVLANYHRATIGGEGGGHHAPIGALLPGDRVLVLDVVPFIVSVEALFAGVNVVDTDGGRTRGLVVIAR